MDALPSHMGNVCVRVSVCAVDSLKRQEEAMDTRRQSSSSFDKCHGLHAGRDLEPTVLQRKMIN